jgi:hypothetical protein
MFTPTDVKAVITPREIAIYKNIFNEELNRLIPSLLSGIWDGKKFVFHKLPDQCGTTLELYGGVDGAGHPQDVTRIDICEYADYRELPATDPASIILELRLLALDAAESYAWNVRNAYLKNGRLSKFGPQRLHIADWLDEFHVNVMVAVGEPLCPGEGNPTGWCSFRYRFVAAKL